jgi:hypothetical protein
MSEHTKDPGAHWGEIQDFWREVYKIYREGATDLDEYPLAAFGDLEIWRQAWARTSVEFRASPVLQRLAYHTLEYRIRQNMPLDVFDVAQRFEVLKRLLAERLRFELELFYTRNPTIPKLSARAKPYICSGWMIRYTDPGYVDYRKK